MSTTTSSFGRLAKRALLIVGTVTIVLGILSVFTDAVAGFFPDTEVLLFLAAIMALSLGVWVFRERYKGGIRQTLVPDVELPISTPAPGDDVDRTLRRLTQYRQGTVEYRNRIQERLGEAAVAVIRQRHGCTRERAVAMLEDGSWTENETAAAFFTGGSIPSPSWRDRLFGDKESGYKQWVSATVDEITQQAELDSETDEQSVETEADRGLLARFRSRSDDSPSGIIGSTRVNYREEGGYGDADRVSENVLYKPAIRTGEWKGATAFALVSAAVGIITLVPALLLVSVVGVGFAAFARGLNEPSATALDVERHLSDSTPQPGEPVEVTVTVRNEGDAFMPDLRLVDRVPESMRVVEGSPRLGTALGSGSRATFSYTVVAERGNHEWPLLAISRDFAGATEREAIVEVDDEMNCVPALRTTSEMPVRSQMSLYSGQIDTTTGGAGLEFHSVRDYQEGDPMKRIDWKRYAQTGDLATVDFREEQAAQVVFLFDARESAYVSPGANRRHALDRGVDAAAEVFAALYDQGDLVGMAAFDTVPCWLGPSAGDEHRERARRIFATHPALSSIPPAMSETEGHYVDPMTHVRRQLSPEMQIMLFSPLCDDYTAEVARRLDSAGHLVTVISPDPTTDGTIGQRLARVERTMRITNLREHGIRVIDWDYDDVLGLELRRAQQRWAV